MLNNKIRLDSFLSCLNCCEFEIFNNDTFEKLFEGECNDRIFSFNSLLDNLDSDFSNYFLEAVFAPMGSLFKIFVSYDPINMIQ